MTPVNYEYVVKGIGYFMYGDIPHNFLNILASRCSRNHRTLSSSPNILSTLPSFTEICYTVIKYNLG